MYNRTNLRHIAVFFLSALFVAACDIKTPATETADVSTTQRSIEAIADDYLAAMLERYPTTATSYAIEGARHDRLFDNSLEAMAEWQAHEDGWLAELNAIGEPADIGSRD